MYDIGIIGAGPAGATLARLVASKHRVLLLNKDRQKCCGGILAPESQKLLAQLDLALPLHTLANPQPFAVTVIDINSKLINHYPRQYINIKRNKFDQWLLSLLPESVDVRSNAVYKKAGVDSKTVEVNGDYLIIHFTENDEPKTEKVRWLVGADGGASLVRDQFFGTDPRLKKYIAFQDWFDNNEIETQTDSLSSEINFQNNYVGIFDNNLTDFYCWTIPKDDQLLIGSAIPLQTKDENPLLPDARNRFKQLKNYLSSIGLNFGQAQKQEIGLIVRPATTNAINLGRNNVLLVGEAAGFISPTSAEGISTALASATALANAINSNKNVLKEYKKNTKNIIWNIRLKYLKKPAMFNPRLRRIVMQSKLTALRK
ncbi:MAG: FAD-binding protein [Planctomycetaceae bacterium]|jgi:flavin-dependent dehydrogenase|nr:FAD-binding protein [Planctomycetaceae bacterium]